MENNSDRLGFALIALSIVAVVLIIMNTIFGPTVKSYFQGLQKWSNMVTNQLNPPQQYTHTAYSWSADGSDRFMTSYPAENLWATSKVVSGWLSSISGLPNYQNAPDAMIPDPITIPSGAKSLVMTTYNPNKVSNFYSTYRVCFFNGSTFIGPQMYLPLTGDAVQTIKWDIPSEADKVYLSSVLAPNGVSVHDPSIHIKYEFGDQATPWTPAPEDDYDAAYPIYRGEYTDYTEADSNDSASQDPSKYTWKLNPDYHE